MSLSFAVMICCMLLADLREMGSGSISRHAILVCSYKAIPVGPGYSGSITTCFRRVLQLLDAFGSDRTTHVSQQEPRGCRMGL